MNNPMRPENSGFLDQTEISQSTSFMFDNQQDKARAKNDVTLLLGKKPEIGDWSK